MKKGLALFDFDGTITTNDTFMEIIKYQKGALKFYLGMMMLSPVLLLYKIKLIKNWKAKEIVLRLFFGGMPFKEFQQRCDDFIVTRLPYLIKKEALIKIDFHKNQQHRIIVVSASPRNWIESWCKMMNVELISTELDVHDHRITGKLKSPNCYGQEKVNRIKAYLALNDYDAIYAYGDSIGDKPMLELAHHAFYRKF